MLQTVAEPIDWVARMLNNKHGYPPLRLRQQVGDLSDFEGSSGEYIAYLKLLCNLKPGDRLLDMGCGCGLICLNTTGSGSILDHVEYQGWDINKQAINWCKKNLERSNAIFAWVGDVTLVDSSYFDVILAKSLFTHLLRDETVDYLEKIKYLLKPGGRCLATFFLLRDQPLKGRYRFHYRRSGGIFALERPTTPKLAVAYNEKWLLNLMKKLELSVQVWYGTWRGNRGGLSFQDVIVMKKP